jgi:hypothetical protein
MEPVDRCEWDARQLGHLLDFWWVDDMQPPDPRLGPIKWAQKYLEPLPPDIGPLPTPPNAYVYWERLGYHGDCNSPTYAIYRDSLIGFWLGQGDYPPPGAYHWLRQKQLPETPANLKLKPLPFAGAADFDMNELLKWWNSPGGSFDWMYFHTQPRPATADHPSPPPEPIG